MLEVIKKTYKADRSSYDEFINDLTSAWSWDNIETIENENGTKTTKFHIGNSYLEVTSADVYSKMKFYGYYNTDSTNSITGAYDSNFYIKYVKTSNALLMHVQISNSDTDNSSYSAGHIIAIGSGTNMITGTKENLMSIIYEAHLQSINDSYNHVFIGSSDRTSTATSFLSPYSYNVNNNVVMTTLKPIYQKESQVIMDNVYVADTCTLSAPSFGECTLGNKKYFTVFHVWVPYD